MTLRDPAGTCLLALSCTSFAPSKASCSIGDESAEAARRVRRKRTEWRLPPKPSSGPRLSAIAFFAGAAQGFGKRPAA